MNNEIIRNLKAIKVIDGFETLYAAFLAVFGGATYKGQDVQDILSVMKEVLEA